MQRPLFITYNHLNIGIDIGKVFEMTGRCAFAICTEGKFKIRILNEIYEVTENSMFACMPFVNIEVISVEKLSHLIFGNILIEDVLRMINQWVNTDNLSAIQTHPRVKLESDQIKKIIALIKDYDQESKEISQNPGNHICSRIEQDIIEYHSKLIVGYVLKAYFAHIPMKLTGYTHRDEVFQRFMLSLYANFREQRDVFFYASHSGVSLKYFSTLIKQLSGKSPSEWIETVVIGEAKSLLNDRQRTIKDIAASLNFPDTPTFTKYFRRVEGVTPKSYRNSILDN